VDCGRYVNPEPLAHRSTAASSTDSAALKGEITVANGRVEQSNSDDYDLLRINETPQTEVPVGRLPIRAEELA
jgi:isoquinoline 1-oxidoreductase beta subunit